MDIVAVDVVQPQNIGVIPVCPLQKAPCGSSRGKAVIIQQAGGNTMKPHIQIRANANRKTPVAIRHGAVSAKGNFGFVPFLLTSLGNSAADLAGTSDTSNGVYDQILHGRHLVTNS